MVDKDACKLRPYSFGQKCSNYRRIHTSRQSQKHFAIAHLFSDCLYLRFSERAHLPVPAAPAHIKHKASDELSSMFSMVHLRMELYSIKASCPVLHTGYRAVIRMCCDSKALRRAADVVGVTHPAGVDIISRCKYPALVIYRDLCATVLAGRSRPDAASQSKCHE